MTESAIHPDAGRLAVADAEPGASAVDPATRGIILEQYKLYVQAAEGTSERRLKTNNFYQALHMAIYMAVWAFLVKEFGEATPGPHKIPLPMLTLPFAVLGVLCVVWWYNIRSYDQLNGKKYQVVGQLEQRLPAQPWGDEWALLERGVNRRVYWPLSRLEKWIPVALGLCDLGTPLLIALIST